MALQRFTTTALSDLRAAGRVGEMQHAVIAPFLARELGPRHGRLFADVEPEGSDLRAWYAEAAGTPRRVADLPAAERDALTRTAAELIGDVARLAERMAGESPQRANLGRILLAATTYPAEDLWYDGDQPIVVNWGFERVSATDTAPRAIADVVPTRAPPQPSRFAVPQAAPLGTVPGAVSVEPRRFAVDRLAAWPLWLLFALLLGAVFRLLLPACAIGPAGWSFAGSCTAAPALATLADEGATLRALVRQAEIDVAARRQICAAPRPERAAAATPAASVPLAPVTAATPPAQVDAQVESRLPAAAPRGGVEVSLLWDDRSDLDLMVGCPGGETLSQSSPDLQACGGHLLQDVNKPGSTLLDHPIEHAAWNAPPPGVYTVKVALWGYNSVAQGSEIPFTVRIRRGSEERVVQGRIKGTHTMVTVTTATF